MAESKTHRPAPLDTSSLSPRARGAVVFMIWAARVFALAVAVQIFLAGLALFVDSDNWAAHSGFARTFVILPVLMIIVSFAARLPGAFRAKSIQLLVMVILMFVTAVLSSDIGFLAALHPVIAAAMLWSSLTLGQQAAESAKAGTAGRAAGRA